jgi:hypothetical protein
MDTKLTLKLDQTVIEKAKEFAKNQSTSLSKLIENYLLSITNEQTSEGNISPLVKSLSGVIKLPNDTDLKEEYSNYLTNKYK